jgi:hypothetical protein
MTLSIIALCIECYAECRYAECCGYINVMLNVVRPSVIMLSVTMLSVVMLSVIMLNVMAPLLGSG